MSAHNILDVIGCASCKSDEDGALFVGQAAKASSVNGLSHCPCCQSPLLPDSIIAIGFDTRARRAQEQDSAA